MDIEINGLTKKYITITALRDVSLEIKRGESVGLVGSNGAGKTTLMNILMGFLSFDEGSVKILGRSSVRLDADTKEQIGFIAEEIEVLPWATLRDLSSLYRKLYRQWDEEMLQRLIDEWGINEGKRMLSLSKGQQRLTELALCFSCRPRIVLLDEPFIGLDAVMRIKVLGLIKQLNTQQGTTVFCSSHILTDVEKMAGRMIILRRGQICLDRQTDDLGSSLEAVFREHYALDVSEDIVQESEA